MPSPCILAEFLDLNLFETWRYLLFETRFFGSVGHDSNE